MRFLWFTVEPLLTWFSEYGWILILAAAVLFGAALAFLLRCKAIAKSASQRPETSDALFLALGGLENCLSASAEGSRVRVALKDLSKADLEELRRLGGLGLFVSGNTVKWTMSPIPQGFVDAVNQAKGGSSS